MRAAAAAALVPLLASAAAAADVVAPVDTSTAPVVADILVERVDVFDPSVPGEDIWPFRVANKLRFVTRERVVRDEILFAPGDRWDPLLALQSERNLRSNYPLRWAEVVPVPRPDGRVDARVRTKDSWTTNPRVSFGTSGGQSTLTYGVEEGNLLGLGKSVSYFHSQGDSNGGYRRSDTFGYDDPRFLRTRLRLGGSFTRSERGDSAYVGLTRPFYELDAPNATALVWGSSVGDGTLVRDGDDWSRYDVRRRLVDASYGVRLPQDRLVVQRAELGWYEESADFSPTGRSPGTLPGSLPADRHLSGPTVGYSWVQPRYIKATYIDLMERVEDFNLGNETRLRTGAMTRGTGADEDRWMFNARTQQGLSLGEGRFVLAAVGVSGRVRRHRWENGLATASANLFWQNYMWSRHRTLIAHAEAAQGRSLDKENQIVLGGSTGLRGYKNDSFVGGRSVLFNLEDRFFFPWEVLHIARFGGAVFFESGSVVPEGSGFSPARFKSDVGFGLRAASTRSAGGGVLRLDLAYALNDGPGRSRWVVSLRAGQAFSLFNSATARVGQSPASRL